MSNRRIRVVSLSQTSMIVLSYRCLFQLSALLCLYRNPQTISNFPPLLDHPSLFLDFSGVRVARSLVLCIVFVRFLLAIVLSVLQFTDSGIFKLF